MSDQQPRLLITGASGHLGQLVVAQLLEKVPAARIVALVRNQGAADRLKATGVEVRRGDYAQPETLDAAFAGIGRVLLISSNALGERGVQHGNVIAAAKRAGVALLAYTSILHADTSPLWLATEHGQTEDLIHASGLPFVLLRNGWYNENYTANIPAALARHGLIGSAGEGRISTAARADFAAAAVAVLTAPRAEAGRIYELAGDQAITMAELAAEISRQSGEGIGYTNLPEADYKAALVQAGLPEIVAGMLADSDAGIAKGALYDNGRQLSGLIGRPTTPITASIAQALQRA